MAGQDELTGGQVRFVPSDLEVSQISGGGSREHRAGWIDRTLCTPRGWNIGLLDRPRECAAKDSQGRLLAEERPARRAGVPEDQIVHGPAPLQFGGSQRGAEPEPDDTEPGRPEAGANRARS